MTTTKARVPEQLVASANMHPDGNGFDITSTIGSVRFGPNGTDATGEAMRIIGEYRKEGVYRFPHEDGGDWVISMEHNKVVGQKDTSSAWDD